MKMLISGSYGTGNLGDEYILKQLLACFGEDYQVTVISQGPKYTRQHFPKVHTIAQSPTFFLKDILKDFLFFKWNRFYDRWVFLKELACCDIFLLGGGGLLVEMIPRVLRYYLFQLRFARWMGKRSLVFGVGVGVMTTEKGKQLMRLELGQVPLIYVRDHYSLESLNTLGITHARLMPDLVLGMGPKSIDKTKAKVGVNLYGPFGPGTTSGEGEERLKNFEDALFGLLNHISASGLSVELFSFGTLDDEKYARKLIERIPGIKPTFYAFTDFSQYARYTYTITMRFHAGVVSLMHGVPSLCLDAQFKSERTLLEMGLGELVVPLVDGINRIGRQDISAELLIERFNNMRKNEAHILQISQRFFQEKQDDLKSIFQEVKNSLKIIS